MSPLSGVQNRLGGEFLAVVIFAAFFAAKCVMPGFWLEFLAATFALNKGANIGTRATRFVAENAVYVAAITLIAFHGVIPLVVL